MAEFACGTFIIFTVHFYTVKEWDYEHSLSTQWSGFTRTEWTPWLHLSCHLCQDCSLVCTTQGWKRNVPLPRSYFLPFPKLWITLCNFLPAHNWQGHWTNTLYIYNQSYCSSSNRMLNVSDAETAHQWLKSYGRLGHTDACVSRWCVGWTYTAMKCLIWELDMTNWQGSGRDTRNTHTIMAELLQGVQSVLCVKLSP